VNAAVQKPLLNLPAPPNPDLVDTSSAPGDYESGSAVVYENFITEEEGLSVVSDLKAKLKR